MERLHQRNDLASFLASRSNRDITIVSAFASGTVDLLIRLLKSNRVEVIVGTINAFTSPRFIEGASRLLKRQFWVDFRGQESIHWKLYLVSPDTVVVGSANFTDLGVGLQRDTCVVIRSRALYREYMGEIRALKRKAGVLNATSPSFAAAKKKHVAQHLRNQAASQAARAAASHKPTFEEWLKHGFSTLPLYVWDSYLESSDKQAVRKIVASRTSVRAEAASSAAPTQKYRDALATDSEGRGPPFAPETIVLTARSSGTRIGFLQMDIVYRHPRKKKDYMIALRKTRYQEPFKLTDPIKQAIKAMILAGEYKGYGLPVDRLRERLAQQERT